MTPFKAVVEADRPGAFLTRSPRNTQEVPAVPWINGLNKDEGCLKSVCECAYTFLDNRTVDNEKKNAGNCYDLFRVLQIIQDPYKVSYTRRRMAMFIGFVCICTFRYLIPLDTR